MTKPPLFPSQYREGTTLAVRTYSPHDPREYKDYSPISIGAFRVQRQPLPGTPMTHYRIFLQDALIGMQSSYPTEADCLSWAKRHRLHQPFSTI
ncbi:hypothetical protein V8G57_15560 [Collimonas sp. H4R21]|uniref:Uncharacterized protein n=1 Tax=Collimonas rhizosphaerae TaxID=3126357 RepID=A0ABU9PXT3_9BURK